jgi:cellobiose transport system substrate-binding protein
MELSRRRFIQASALTAMAAGFSAACGSSGSAAANGKDLALWYWGGGLSDKVVADAKTRFAKDITLTANSVGGDFKQKLVTTLAAGGSSVPDITGIKGEDMASFIPSASKFLDLNTLGFKDISSQYLAWKVKRAQTPDGRQLGFPIDIGPTGMYYRVDLFEQAGLPTDPKQVAEKVKTWDDFFAVGAQLHQAVPKSFPVRNLPELFSIVINQGTKRFIDENNHFIGDQDHVRTAWNTAVKAVTTGLDGKVDDASWNAAIATGTLGIELGAAWHALDIEQAAPDLKGKWRVAPMPGGPANDGGSFLALPRQCRNPEQAFKIISWMLSPENDVRGFTDAALFPAAPAAYKLPAMTAGDPYFGGQSTIDVFGPAAQAIPISYEAPADAAVMAPFRTELTNVESSGKSPDAAWNDALSQAKQIAQRQGVS